MIARVHLLKTNDTRTHLSNTMSTLPLLQLCAVSIERVEDSESTCQREPFIE